MKAIVQEMIVIRGEDSTVDVCNMTVQNWEKNFYYYENNTYQPWNNLPHHLDPYTV